MNGVRTPEYIEVLTTVPVNVTLFWNRIFADNQVNVSSLEWALIQYDCVLIKMKFGHRKRHTKGECHLKKKRIGVIHLQAKECQRLTENHHGQFVENTVNRERGSRVCHPKICLVSTGLF